MVRIEGFLLNGECTLVVFLGLCESALVGYTFPRLFNEDAISGWSGLRDFSRMESARW